MKNRERFERIKRGLVKERSNALLVVSERGEESGELKKR